MSRVQPDFDILSGKRKDRPAELLRWALSLASLPYLVGTELRHFAFNSGLLPVRAVDVPVISIGNLTTGGTGKTPTVAWLVQQLLKAGLKPGIVSRGYQALSEAENDEKRLLSSMFPEVPHEQQPDRRAAARRLLSNTSSNVIVLDDGFQHRRLHRDLDLVLIDTLNPWGYGHLLPRGLLRERMAHLSRADAIFLTRCDLAAPEQLQQIEHKIAQVASAHVYRTAFRPRGWINSSGDRLPLHGLPPEPVIAFCGIGNPDGFEKTLAGCLTQPVLQMVTFPDHHHYCSGDFRRLKLLAGRSHVHTLVTTCKDLVKLPQQRTAGLEIWALEIGLEPQGDLTPLQQQLQILFPEQPFHLTAPAETPATSDNTTS